MQKYLLMLDESVAIKSHQVFRCGCLVYDHNSDGLRLLVKPYAVLGGRAVLFSTD